MIPQLHCPCGGCPLAGRSFPCINSLVGHINDCHSGSFVAVPDKAFHRLTLFPCRHCGKIYKDQAVCNRHVQNKHRVLRTKTNVELVAEILPAGAHGRWETALPFLDNRVKVRDPLFRSKVFNALGRSVVPLVLKAQVDVIELLLAAAVEVENSKEHPKHQTREDPFGAFLLYFDVFILRPPPKGHKGSVDLLVQQRLWDLYEGHIPELYRKAYAACNDRAQKGSTPPDDAARARSAQCAANLDELSTCCDHLYKRCGVAPTLRQESGQAAPAVCPCFAVSAST